MEKKKDKNKKRLTRKKLVNRFRRKKIKKAFVVSKNEFDFFPKKSIDELKFFTPPDPEEEILLEMTENRPMEILETPQIRKTNRRSKKYRNENDMWAFSSGCSALEYNRLEGGAIPTGKVFWKTSKLSFPISVAERSSNPTQNMLWRSLHHLQRFCEEKCINMQQISEVFNVEFQKIAENNSLKRMSLLNNGTTGTRKIRLSRWTLFGHDNKCLRGDPVRIKSSRYFRKKRNLFDECLQSGAVSPGGEDDSGKDESSLCGEYCNCSCEKCADDLNRNTSVEVTKQLRKLKMAPNSEEDSQIAFSNKRAWGMEFADKEPLRPPVYNPEDYASSLKKWGKKGNAGSTTPQYLSQSTGSLEKFSEELTNRNKRQSSPSIKSSSSVKSGDEKQSKKEKDSTLKVEKKDLKNKENMNRGLKNVDSGQKDFVNPILSLSPQTGEMSLRQFSSVTELLGKLKVDLKLSFPSFVQEFVGDPIDGVTLILELLRAVQLSQTSQMQRCPPQLHRRALLDEHSCLVCLKHCMRCSDASRRLASSPAGLFTLAVCIMSNVTQSRIIALELLTKACEPQAGGHKAVSEALSTLRLRFGEPVRFRFLVGMLSSAGAIELLTTAMKFINMFVESAPNLQQKVYIQAELEQAGFDSEILRKTLPSNSESVRLELNRWEKNYFDIESLQNKAAEVNVLQEKIHLLEKRIKILQEEKGILQSLEQCLKERCSELEEEVSIKTTGTGKTTPSKPFRMQQNLKTPEKGESTPAEDEGISSSEQELSQDEDYIKGRIPYNNATELEQITNLKKMKNVKPFKNEPNVYLNKTSDSKHTTSCNLKNLKNVTGNKMKETNVDDGNEIIPIHGEEEEEEETTIDEVIEELENIVNDAETEVYANEEKVKLLEVRHFIDNSNELSSEEKCLTYTRQTFIQQEKNNFEESEIIPAVLHPQPPKKAKSLIHIYFPGSDFDSHDRNKSEFFEDSDSESSDSLLTTTREKKSLRKDCHKSLEISDSFNSFSSVNTRSLFIKQDQEFEESELNPKLSYEERNIDEEEIKRKHLKAPAQKENVQYSEVIFKAKSQKVQNDGVSNASTEKYNEFGINYDRNVYQNRGFNDRPRKLVPTPVKRSQTFHITTSNGENLLKKSEIKPKPKMGVSGLDFQRTSEQKMKTDNWKYHVTEHNKNLEKRVETNDRYLKKAAKDSHKTQEDEKSDGNGSVRRGSFSGSFSIIRTNRGKNTEPPPVFSLLNKSTPSMRAKSVEKIDEGLNSLVDIVISTDETKKPKPRNEWNAEAVKNIGPRTRRSLAESSLFCPQYTKTYNKSEEAPKPPKPAQRTSLARNNSSSMHLPIEIKLAPVQPKPQQQVIYNFGMKPAKSVDSLLASSENRGCPPDGSSSPLDFKKNQENLKFPEDKTPRCISPVKPAKVQTYFGNPKFDAGSANDQGVNHKYFETNYAAVTNEKSVNPPTRNVQNTVNSLAEKLKNQVLSSNQPKMKTNCFKPINSKDNQTQSKPNFLLGTYQSQSSNNSPKPKMNVSVLQSINTFNNNPFISRNNGLYPGSKKNSREYNNFSAKDSRQASSTISGSEKVTDSPSGLY